MFYYLVSKKSQYIDLLYRSVRSFLNTIDLISLHVCIANRIQGKRTKPCLKHQWMRRKHGYPYKNNDIGMVMVNVMCMYWLATKGKILSDNYLIEHFKGKLSHSGVLIGKYSTFYCLHC